MEITTTHLPGDRTCLETAFKKLSSVFGYSSEKIGTLPLGDGFFPHRKLYLDPKKQNLRSNQFALDFGMTVQTLGIICSNRILPSTAPLILGVTYMPSPSQAVEAIQNDFEYVTIVLFNGGDHVPVSKIVKGGLKLGQYMIAVLYAEPDDQDEQDEQDEQDDQDDYYIDYNSICSWPMDKKREAEQERNAEVRITLDRNDLKLRRIDEKQGLIDKELESLGKKMREQEEWILRERRDCNCEIF